jgi:hypothetical protein
MVGRRFVAAFPLLVVGLAADTGCYDIGDGTSPPTNAFYFPVGLQVSHGGTVLYAANSDFDLQFNGGTLQSYDLRLIREHAVIAISDPTNSTPLAASNGLPPLPLARGAASGCPDNPPVTIPGSTIRQPLGATCAPPTDSTFYVRDAAVIGAFATNLLLSLAPADLVSQATKVHADDQPPPAAPRSFDRLFAPVRGNATMTWATVSRDNFDSAPDPSSTKDSYAPFRLDCGQDGTSRCDDAHGVGQNPDAPGDTRNLTLPGEPFGAVMSADGTAILFTHQDVTDTSLFTTGLGRDVGEANASPPALQFVLDRVPVDGMGIAQIPHDPDAFLGAASLPRPAYLQTSRTVPQISLIRQYSDEEGNAVPSLQRPFIDLETTFPVTAAAGGSDSRGIAIDASPRFACKSLVPPVGPGQTVADRDRQIAACAQKPARAFIANRTPPALLVGDVGGTQGVDGAFNPDQLIIHTSVPLSAGPSNVYLAPIVDRDGSYALRVFVVCFDAAQVFVYDPDGGVLENVIQVGIGPFAMTFDPFDMTDVATHAKVPIDERDAKLGLRRYRFGYVASFTQSYVQLIDLDNAVQNPISFERIVYTLGVPTNPKGT